MAQTTKSIKVPALYKAKAKIIDPNTKPPLNEWNTPTDNRPTIHVNSSQIEELSKLEVGKEYFMEIKVKLLSNELTDHVKGDTYRGKFAITEYKIESISQEAAESE